MGAGVSKERQYQIIYKALHATRRQLQANGVECQYKKSALYGNNGTDFFSVTYRRISASNGECCIYPCIGIDTPESHEYYDSLKSHNYDKGLARIVELCATPKL